MSGAQGKPPGKADEPRLVEVTVAARRSIDIGDRRHGPLSRVRVALEEVPALRRNGFLHDGDQPAVAVQDGRVEGPTVNGQAGNVVTPR